MTSEEYFGELKLLFNTKGWEILTKEFSENANVLNNVQSIQDSDTLNFRKGQLAVIGYFLNLPQTVQQLEEQENEVVHSVESTE